MMLRRFWVWSVLLLCLLIVASAEALPNAGDASLGLAWPAPPLENPVTVTVEPQTDRVVQVIELARDQDAIIVMPAELVTQALVLKGGRNVVLIGGEISIPWQGDDATIASRTGLKLVDNAGIVHIEGLVIGGDDLSEGIQIDAPQAIVQIQNVGIDDVHARDQVDFTDNHPDLIQPYGGFVELRVSNFTGSSDYQGFFFAEGVPFEAITLKRVNLHGMPTARYLLWFGPADHAGTVHLQDVWISIPVERGGGLGKSVWPDVQGDYPAQAQIDDVIGTTVAFWPVAMQPTVHGMIFEGVPPGGDYVQRDQIGLDYQSPVVP